MPSPTLQLFYIPVPPGGTGLALARGAVEKKLAACGNLLPGVTSVYEWEGKMCEDREEVLILKTTPERADALEAWLLKAHPYETPCVLRLPPATANPGFVSWASSHCERNHHETSCSQ